MARSIRNEINASPDPGSIKLVCVGDKSRAILSRLFPKNIILAANEVGRLPPSFLDATKLAIAIFNSGFDFDSGKIVYNRFKSVVSYSTTELPVFSLAAIQVSALPLLESKQVPRFFLERAEAERL